jgi:hypothetical protein
MIRYNDAIKPRVKLIVQDYINYIHRAQFSDKKKFNLPKVFFTVKLLNRTIEMINLERKKKIMNNQKVINSLPQNKYWCHQYVINTLIRFVI